MAKQSKKELEQAIEDMADELDIDAEDYGFVIGPTGKLKMVFMPDNGVNGDIPESVKKILKIFKIHDAGRLENGGVLH